MIPRRSLAAILGISLLALPALASSGDRLPAFTSCKATCEETHCYPSAPPIASHLRLLLWTCPDDCAYHCSHHITDESDAGREHYHQFYGKWAFYRLWGVQEPASVLLSLGNLLVHCRGLKAVRRGIKKENKLRVWLEAAAVIQMNTWLWSAVFHTRDMYWTEKLDYFSAMITVAFTLLYALLRIFGLLTPRTGSPLLPVAGGVTVLFLLWHFWYVLSFDHFPYGYHVGVAIAFGMVGNVVWTLWSASFFVRVPFWPQPYAPRNALASKRPSHAFTPAILVALTMLAMSLEVLDFPPIRRVLDAHAFWHLATIPLAEAWYRFLIVDANDLEVAQSAHPLTATKAT